MRPSVRMSPPWDGLVPECSKRRPWPVKGPEGGGTVSLGRGESGEGRTKALKWGLPEFLPRPCGRG